MMVLILSFFNLIYFKILFCQRIGKTYDVYDYVCEYGAHDNKNFRLPSLNPPTLYLYIYPTSLLHFFSNPTLRIFHTEIRIFNDTEHRPNHVQTWVIGTVMFINESLLNFSSFNFAPQSMLASLGSI